MPDDDAGPPGSQSGGPPERAAGSNQPANSSLGRVHVVKQAACIMM